MRADHRDEPFAQLVEQVMTTEPYASAARVFWIVDNGSLHNGSRSVAPMQAAWPTACLIHLPIHASWLNQIEIFFSIVQRKVITPQDFADLQALADRLAAFEDRYNATAEPFDWHYTRQSLDRHLQRLTVHEPLSAAAANVRPEVRFARWRAAPPLQFGQVLLDQVAF